MDSWIEDSLPEHQDQSSSVKLVKRQCPSDHRRQPSESANVHHRLSSQRAYDLPTISLSLLPWIRLLSLTSLTFNNDSTTVTIWKRDQFSCTQASRSWREESFLTFTISSGFMDGEFWRVFRSGWHDGYLSWEKWGTRKCCKISRVRVQRWFVDVGNLMLMPKAFNVQQFWLKGVNWD